MYKICRVGFSVALSVAGLVSSLTAQGIVTEISLGVHAGVEVSDGDIHNWRLGPQAVLELAGFVEIAPGFNIYTGETTSFPAFAVETSGWQAMLDARVSPFGRGFFCWYWSHGASYGGDISANGR